MLLASGRNHEVLETRTMANSWYNTALNELAAGTLTITAFKIMMVGTDGTTYAFDADHDFVDNGANDATDPSFCELACTNYVGGHQGAGRHATANETWAVDKPNNRAEMDADDPAQWSNLGGGGDDDTVSAFIVFEERASDALSLLVAYIDTVTGLTFPYPTNGSHLNFAVNAEGLLHLSSV